MIDDPEDPGEGAEVLDFPGLPPGARDDRDMERWPSHLDKPDGLSAGDAAVMAALGEAALFATGTSWTIEDFNAEFAVVLVGGKTMVLKENPDDPEGLVPRIELLRREDFEFWMRPNKTVVVSRAKKNGAGFVGKVIPSSQIWMSSPRRRQYRGIEFAPAPPGEDYTRSGFYNLWRGFSVEPDSRGDAACRLFLDHVRDNVAQGNMDLFDWIIGFLAQMVQQPHVKPGVALVMRGKQGVGKSTIGDVMGALFPANYVLADQGRYVTGQFNAHLADCLLLQADEAFWAGDHDAEGKLKGMVTGRYQMIERKNVDPIKVANHVRLIITSNSDWVVPAGPEERRFCVVDVGDECMQDRTYFGALYRQMFDAGGLGGLLHYLLQVDLEAVDLNRIPETGALYEQKVHGLKPEERWWLERLQDGSPVANESGWITDVGKARMLKDYQSWADSVGVKHKASAQILGFHLKRMLPWIITVKSYQDAESADPAAPRTRVNCYRLPDLKECRTHFAKLVHSEVEWDKP